MIRTQLKYRNRGRDGQAGDGSGAPRVNFLDFTEALDNAYWTKNNVTVSANSTTGPFGMLLDTVVENTATGANHHITKQPIPNLPSVAVGTYVTVSCYAKAGVGTRRLQIVVGGTAFAVSPYSNFNLQTPAAVKGAQSASISVSMTSEGSGIYRCAFTVLADTLGSVFVFYRLNTTDAAAFTSYTGDGASSLILGGMQCQIGPSVSGYEYHA